MDAQEVYRAERDQANLWAKYYFNLRLGIISFFIVSFAAILSYGWTNAFQRGFDDATLKQKFVRVIIIFAADLLAVGVAYIEKEFRRRYDIAWGHALRYEKLLRIEGGFHECLWAMDDPEKVTLRSIAEMAVIPIAILLVASTMIEAINWIRFSGG